jgi:hypothetical protein
MFFLKLANIVERLIKLLMCVKIAGKRYESKHNREICQEVYFPGSGCSDIKLSDEREKPFKRSRHSHFDYL